MTILSKPLTKDDKWALIPEFLRLRGLVNQHIDSYNYFVNVAMKRIVAANNEVRIKNDHTFLLRYTNIYVGSPVTEEVDSLTERETTPMECRIRSLTYEAPIYVDVIVNQGNIPPVEHKHIKIGSVPVMLRSCKCVLNGLTEAQLAAKQECPYDPGGYFIIRGLEKVVLTQEQLSRNRILLEEGKYGGVDATVTSSTAERKTRVDIVMKHNKFYLSQNVFSKDIPIVVVLRAMGIESDQEIMSMIGYEEKMMNLFESSIQECYELNIFSELKALDYIGGMIKATGKQSKKSRIEDARDKLYQVILPHVPADNYNFYNRAIYICYMIRQIILCLDNPSMLSDKDYYGNKRLELTGHLLALLFEGLFKEFNNKVSESINKSSSNSLRAGANILNALSFNKEKISGGFCTAIGSGNWKIGIFKMERKGVTETLSRLSYIAAIGQMTRVNAHVEKTRKISGPRALQPSHFGMICPSDTPEGAQCGLVKNLAILAHVTIEEDDKYLTKTLYNLGVEDASLLPGEALYTPPSYIVMLNGNILGIHRNPPLLVNAVKRLRRRGMIGEFVSVCMDSIERVVTIASDSGRVCRPLIIVDNVSHKPRVSKKDIYDLNRGLRDIQSFLKEGLVEYVDANEENTCNIALDENHINEKTSHMEIDAVTILGIVSSLIPYPHHNQSPRNTYQCAMGKQAIGTIGENQNIRIDLSPLNIIVYPQKPMVRSKVLDLVHFNDLPAGQNAIVAVMSYSGYDIEDAVILNRGSIDRGYGRVIVHKKYQSSLVSHVNNTCDVLVGPPKFEDQNGMNINTFKKRNKKYEKLGLDGIIEVGVRVEEGDILINKESPSSTKEMNSNVSYIPCPLVYKDKNGGIVDKVMLTTSKEEKSVIKILIRDMRRPELGDKYSSRHGQKGVVGLIVNEEDMPFNESGIRADMIMNPHGFPSRMTVGKMIELIGGKAGLLEGKRKFGTAFGGDEIKDLGEILVSYGYNYHGKDLLYSGINGEPLLAYIFMGPIYYQRLKHMVKDKVFARARGPHVSLTRQPTQGRAREGGLRVGEMEKDCLIAHGSSLLLVERLLVSSDPFICSICCKCGLMSYKGWCEYCKSGENVNEICIPYACKLLFQELESMNVIPRFTMSSGGYYNQSLVDAQNIK